MILHVVLFDLQERSSSAWAEVEAKLRALGGLPMVRSLAIGECLELEEVAPVLRSRDHRYAAVFTFKSEDDVRAYLRHPVHQEIATELRARFSSAKVVDVKVLSEVSHGEGTR
jgi:hypothetical protein